MVKNITKTKQRGSEHEKTLRGTKSTEEKQGSQGGPGNLCTNRGCKNAVERNSVTGLQAVRTALSRPKQRDAVGHIAWHGDGSIDEALEVRCGVIQSSFEVDHALHLYGISCESPEWVFGLFNGLWGALDIQQSFWLRHRNAKTPKPS